MQPNTVLDANSAVEPWTLARRTNRPGSQRLVMPTADTLPVAFPTVTAADGDRPRAHDHAIKAVAAARGGQLQSSELS